MNPRIIDKSELITVETISVNKAIGHSTPVPSTIARLRQIADRAMLLGNIAKSKVKIIFQTKEGVRQVHTTVWATTQDDIVLKGGRSIPMAAIINILE